MEAADLLAHRPALIGAAIALALGLTGGLILKTGPQSAPMVETYAISATQFTGAEPIAWRSGKPADYVLGTDFTRSRPQEQPPVVVASYEVPEYVPTAWSEPTPPQPPPARLAQVDRAWPSTNGDILDTRLPEDAPDAPHAPEASQAPVAPAAPVALAAAY
jgi:hypothetical protein